MFYQMKQALSQVAGEAREIATRRTINQGYQEISQWQRKIESADNLIDSMLVFRKVCAQACDERGVRGIQWLYEKADSVRVEAKREVAFLRSQIDEMVNSTEF